MRLPKLRLWYSSKAAKNLKPQVSMFHTNPTCFSLIPWYRRFSTYYFGSNPVSIVSNAEMKTTNILPQLQHDQDPKILQILPLRTVVMPYLSAGSNAGGPITTLSKVSQQISRCRSFTTSLVIVISDSHENGFPKLFQHGESRKGSQNMQIYAGNHRKDHTRHHHDHHQRAVGRLAASPKLAIHLPWYAIVFHGMPWFV